MEASPPTGGLREELRSDAQTVTHTAKDRLHSEVDARKGTAATQAKSLSSALDAAAGQLGDSPNWLRSAFEQGAQTIQRFADTIEQKDSRQLSRDVQQLARENPGTFLAGCALAGFAAARVLKAGVEETASSSGGASNQLYDPFEGRSEASSVSGSQAYEPYQPSPSGTSGSSDTAFSGMSGEPTREPALAGELP